MGCKYCGRALGYHDTRCPLYEEPNAKYKCQACDEGIFPGDEYVEFNGKYIHYDCADIYELLDLFEAEIMTMEDD
ncbi:MAG: hypothetical protein KBT35_07985 [Firmicutes bacterium]|nr:hypothetical protein [Candidatus Colivicinus equi]